MEIVKPEIEILALADGETMLRHIERCARKCYQSQHRTTENSYESFVRGLIDSGHESTIEHCSITVDITCDRGITHEIVRHRLCAFSQESTRYVNYAKEKYGESIKLIDPFFFDPMEEAIDVEVPTLSADVMGRPQFDTPQLFKMNSFDAWYLTNMWAEWGYMALVNKFGRTAQEARSVLPNSTKTAISVTCNLREWRHIFKLRADGPAHPQMRQIMLPLLDQMAKFIPIVFDDYREKFADKIDEFKANTRADIYIK